VGGEVKWGKGGKQLAQGESYHEEGQKDLAASSHRNALKTTSKEKVCIKTWLKKGRRIILVSDP